MPSGSLYNCKQESKTDQTPGAWPYAVALARKYLKKVMRLVNRATATLFGMKPIFEASRIDDCADGRPRAVRVHERNTRQRARRQDRASVYDLDRCWK